MRERGTQGFAGGAGFALGWWKRPFRPRDASAGSGDARTIWETRVQRRNVTSGDAIVEGMVRRMSSEPERLLLLAQAEGLGRMARYEFYRP
jgi:hypothetical protein